MSGIPTIYVSEAVHYLDSSLSLDTVRYAYDPRPEGSAAIDKAYASDAHEFVCYRCADDLGTTFERECFISGDDVISEDWENVAIIAGNLGLSWKCDMCDKTVHEMDENTDAYLIIHNMD